ncbi:adhesion G protein-coupled receptor B2 isoform X2 [Betta splendens]|uniref:Adhesion G protein-coupled receptor B2 isoform X2 n=1 Tax=Betta splendens TaxID=158456 RepID=A0A9W2Y4V8_BETSP|nr:adhesion G protein-coupled receptor B2 isoform X2 [Betta splendens]
MNTAGGVCLSVLSSLLAVAGALAALSALALAPLSALAEVAHGAGAGAPVPGAEGAPAAASPPCSSLVAGVLYGSFSLRELFPSREPTCSWSLENPDPTKYSLYLRFTRHPVVCRTHAPMLLSLDHHLANQSCPLHLQTAAARDSEVVDLCGSRSDSDGPYSFLQFDKNFIQLCLTRHPAADEPPVAKELLELRLVEVLLINNENSSQFTCGMLCRWFEECLRTGHDGDREVSDGDGCGMTQTGCICPNHNILAPPVPLLPETPHGFSNGSLLPDDCCVTELHSNDAIVIAPRDVRQDPYDDDLKVKTQRPRSADQPGVFQAQTGDPAAEEWSQWSVCSLTCGQGWQVRTRSCVSSPYGTLCSGALRETRMCNNNASCPGEPGLTGAVHGLWEEWSSWSLCSVTCGRGSRTRTRRCVNGDGAVACEHPETQTKLCNIAVCPVEGQWLEWGPWSRCSVTCNVGTEQRQRRCSASAHGWAECKGPHQESRECINPSCSGGGNWGSWNHWSLCSKTCDSGWQRRFRMCEGTGVQGYPCDGSGEEVRACNEKKCPAPHEICKDEHLLSMAWKRASAGETVYNKCPTNATGSASRRCMLDNNGVAFWGLPSFARCVSVEYRYLHLSLREHLAKGQRTLAGEGMSQIVRSLLELLQRRSYYSGDLLFSTEILRNVTDTFKRATYIPAPDDVQKFFQIVSHMLDIENLEKWKDAHQVAPGAALLMRILEDFIHLIGEAQKPFQSFLVVTNNLMITIQREPVSAVSSDINFPMKGRRGMKDWARTAEDKLYIPKEVFTMPAEETETDSESTVYYVIGAILYRTLGVILPAPIPPAVINSKILTVTVRPEPQPTEPMVVVELSPLFNGTSDPQCVVWDYGNPEAGAGNWGTEGCQTLASTAVHTKCLCSRISTYAVLAQQAKDPVSHRPTAHGTWGGKGNCYYCTKGQDMGPTSMPSVPLMVGCGVSCTALLILLLIYAAFWRYIRSERSIILVNFCLSILASNLLILVGQSQTLSKGLCTVTAAFLHFFFLASFCWVLTEAWQSYLAVIGKMRSRLIRKRFLCLGWGLPALVVAVSVGFTRARGYGTASYCWLSLEGGLLYAFVGPAAVIVLVNMLIGIVVFNKLMSRDGISDKSKKQRAGVPAEARSRLLLKCSKCGVISSTALSSSTASSAMASLWSSCVVLPLLALTWMSAVLAITDRRSTLFQVLFAVFDSVQGFVIITVHCAMRREVQDAVRCRMGGCKDDSENSPDSCKNGQVQIMRSQSHSGQRCGTSLCLPVCHSQLFASACQKGCSHSLPRGGHSHALSHAHELSDTHNHIGSQPHSSGNHSRFSQPSGTCCCDGTGRMCTHSLHLLSSYPASLPQTDFEKDVDLACQTERGHPFIFKEVNTCNPATITGTLSRISLDDEDDPKLTSHQEGGVNFSSLPGNIPPPNLIVQVPPLGGLNELSETPLKKEMNVDQQRQQGQQRSGAPIYLCTESGLGWARPPASSNNSQDGSAGSGGSGGGGSGGGGEGDYMVLPRRTVSLKPSTPSSQGGVPGGEDKPLNITVEDPPFPPPPSPLSLHPAESEAYPADFVPSSVGDMNIAMNLNRSYGTIKTIPHVHGHMIPQSGLVHPHGGHMHPHGHSLQLKPGQRPSVRQILTGGTTVERTRTLPRNLGSTNANTSISAGSLERKRVRYSELDFEKVMHTRKRHSELYHELNHSSKFHTIDRYSRDPAMSTFKREKRWSISSAGGERNSSSDKSTPEDQTSWDSFKTMTPELSIVPGEQKDRMELHNKNWDSSSANTPDSSEGDFQTEV